MPVSNCPFRLLIVFYHTDTELEKMGIGWDRRGDSTDSTMQIVQGWVSVVWDVCTLCTLHKVTLSCIRIRT